MLIECYVAVVTRYLKFQLIDPSNTDHVLFQQIDPSNTDHVLFQRIDPISTDHVLFQVALLLLPRLLMINQNPIQNCRLHYLISTYLAKRLGCLQISRSFNPSPEVYIITNQQSPSHTVNDCYHIISRCIIL